MIVAAAAVALSVVAVACCVRRAAVPWLLWPLAILLALSTLAPREFARRERAVEPQRVALSGTSTAETLLAAAGRAGPHVDDLRVELRDDAPLADGYPWSEPIGARGTLPNEPLPFAPSAVVARAPAPLQVGRPGLLEVAVPRAAGWLVRLEVFGPAGLLARDEAAADGGVRELAVQPEQLGPHRLVVTIEQAAAVVELVAALPVAAPTPTLVVADDEVAAEALRAQGVLVERVAAAPADWSAYAAVLLAAPLADGAQSDLVRAVEDGLGLLVLEPAFGAADAPLRAVLPVRPAAAAPRPANGGDGPGETPTAQPQTEPPPADEPPSELPIKSEEREIDKRLVALALVVDRSGSMGTSVHGRTKMSYAKTSAQRTAEALGRGDEVAVVTFGNKDAGRVELPLTDAAETATVQAGVGKLAHGPEQTYLLSGLRVAGEQLRGSKAVVKHVVVISDGEFNTSESVALRSLAYDLFTRDKVSVSVIAITDSFTSPQFLAEVEELTRDGGGRFLPLDDAGLVPQFVTGEVTRALASVGRLPNGAGGGEPVAAATKPPSPNPAPPPKRDPPPPPSPREVPRPTELTVVAVAESAVLGSEPPDGWPALGSARAGEAPLDAEVLLAVGDQGWPLLAFANRGLGRVGAFAADLFGPDAAAFRREPGFPGRLAQWLAHTRAPAALAPVALAFAEPQMRPSRPLPAVAEAFGRLLGGAPEVAPGPAEVRRYQEAVWSPLLPGWLPLLWLGLLALAERLAVRHRNTASD